eukprot:1157437-Pelagomonas_calceolata.AAC.7
MMTCTVYTLQSKPCALTTSPGLRANEVHALAAPACDTKNKAPPAWTGQYRELWRWRKRPQTPATPCH